jgi:hypothetical protein
VLSVGTFDRNRSLARSEAGANLLPTNGEMSSRLGSWQREYKSWSERQIIGRYFRLPQRNQMTPLEWSPL